MTAVDSEMKPSWYKDPTWIFRDDTLFPGFSSPVKVLQAEYPIRLSYGCELQAPTSKGTGPL